jgi:CRISPR-associated protein Cas5t
MKVARVEIEAPVASFRYPHFLIGRQPTFAMPPPSTIYGQVAAALGWLPARSDFRFAYRFVFSALGSDLEHQHIVFPGRPDKVDREEGALLTAWQKRHRLNLGGTIQPVARDFLFGCRLTLYLDPAQFGAAFRHPAFCLTLGRSQDLAAVLEMDEVELEEADGAYLEHALLPFEAARPRTAVGSTVLMPSFVGPPPERDAEFARYVVLHERVFVGAWDQSATLPRGSWAALRFESDTRRWLVDLDSAEIAGVKRGVEWVSFG